MNIPFKTPNTVASTDSKKVRLLDASRDSKQVGLLDASRDSKQVRLLDASRDSKQVGLLDASTDSKQVGLLDTTDTLNTWLSTRVYHMHTGLKKENQQQTVDANIV